MINGFLEIPPLQSEKHGFSVGMTGSEAYQRRVVRNLLFIHSIFMPAVY